MKPNQPPSATTSFNPGYAVAQAECIACSHVWTAVYIPNGTPLYCPQCNSLDTTTAK
jgi:Zn finger protein HypA/HybF involved in hydrogenase expression